MLIKVKLSLCLHTTTINRVRDSEIKLHPSIVELGRWMRAVSFKRHPLYSRNKSPGCPLDRKMGEPKSQSEHNSKEIIPAPVEIRTSIVQTLIKEIISRSYKLVTRSS
jgi:hypothetical protein